MNAFYLNVGLWHAGTQDEMMIALACAAVEGTGLKIRRLALLRKPGEEPCLVVNGQTPLDRGNFDELVMHVSKALDQDCIATWWCPAETGGVSPGALIGPRAAAWGAFDASLFNFL